jgi:molecular chaperone DnaK
VSAVDKATSKKQSIRIESSSGLSKEEIEKMKLEAEQNAESDKKIKEDVDTLNSADNMIFQMNKSLEDLGDKISEEDKSEITSSISELKESHSKKEIDSVKRIMEELTQKFQKISQDLYESVNQESNDGGMDASDVEFEEVGS